MLFKMACVFVTTCFLLMQRRVTSFRNPSSIVRSMKSLTLVRPLVSGTGMGTSVLAKSSSSSSSSRKFNGIVPYRLSSLRMASSGIIITLYYNILYIIYHIYVSSSLTMIIIIIIFIIIIIIRWN